MATRRFAFEPGGPLRLEITWKLGFRDIRVRLDGAEVLQVPFISGFGRGAELTFGDGAVVYIRLADRFWPDFDVSLDGRRLEPIRG